MKGWIMKKSKLLLIFAVFVFVIGFPSIAFALDEQNIIGDDISSEDIVTDSYSSNYIVNKGMGWVKQNDYYDFGVAYATNDPNPQFQWMYYNEDTKVWTMISDYGKYNWVSWKTTQGNYWILCRLKTSDSTEYNDQICTKFRYDFDDFSTGIVYQGTDVLLGCSSNIVGVKYKFQIYNYDEKIWEWGHIQATSWARWTAHRGNYLLHFEILSADNRMIGQRSFNLVVPYNQFTYVYTNNTQSSARLTIDFPSVDGKLADNIGFAVWSDIGNRDDIMYFKANRGDGFKYSIDIVQGWFKHAGWFTVQIATGQKYFSEYKVCLNESDTAMLYARIRLDQIGWSLGNAYNWSTAFPYRTLPLDWSGNAYAQYGLSNCAGNCYAKAASFVYMARQLGYAAHVITGSVPSTRGGTTPHGWAEVYINGQTYVCDPDFEYETGRNGYMITYGQSGTWVYYIGGILD